MNQTRALPLLHSLLRAVALTALATAVAWAMDGAYSLASQAMAYLLAVVFSAFRFGRRDSMLTAVAGVVALNFFFVPPRFTLNIENADYGFTLAALLLVSLVVSGLATRLKAETVQARLRERRARQLHALADALAAAEDEALLLGRSSDALSEAFGKDAVLLLPDATGALKQHGPGSLPIDGDAAKWAFEQRRSIGPGTAYWPELPRWYTPLPGDERALGVATVVASLPDSPGIGEALRHLEAFARQIGLALQRGQLTQRVQAAALEVKTESVRNALLASISHDMRTPLSAILGSATTLSGQRQYLSEAQQQELLRNIEDEVLQMTATAENILQLARLSSQRVGLRRDWESLGEIIGAVVGRQRRRGDQRLVVRVAPDLPLVYVDAVLIAQVLANLIGNAERYAPDDSPIEVAASSGVGELVVTVEDRGPGLGGEDPARLFGKFQRGRDAPAQGGAGLGLAICKAIVELHGGRIDARNRDGGGATFEFSLPRGVDAPALPASIGPEAGDKR
ncbi:MAG TPA: ATP-binding protein [Burkholderiales bacterium]